MRTLSFLKCQDNIFFSFSFFLFLFFSYVLPRASAPNSGIQNYLNASVCYIFPDNFTAFMFTLTLTRWQKVKEVTD